MNLTGPRRAGPPRLFPDLGPVTAGVLFHGVPGAPSPPFDLATWEKESPVLIAEGLAGMALSAIGQDPGVLERVATTLKGAHRAEIAMSRVAEAWAPEVLDHLHRDGIQAVVVKGPVVARLYPEARLRPFEDMDILVPPKWFRSAMGSLSRAGFRLPKPPRDYFLLRCREGVNLGRSDGASIDLHHRISPWAFTSRLKFERIYAGAAPLSLARGVVHAASPNHNLLIAALQIVGFRAGISQKLKAWRDVYVLAGCCDPAEAASEARDVGLDWYLALVLRQMPTYAIPSELLRALGDVAPNARQSIRLRQLVPPALGARNYSIGRLFRLPLANGIAYAVAKTFPSGRFLEELYGSRWAFPRWWWSAQEHLMESAALDPGQRGNGTGAQASRDPDSSST